MKSYPLRFHPLIKRTIWGGRRLGDCLGKPVGSASDYAESWEIVDCGEDQSVVMEGDLAGRTLSQLLATHRQSLIGDTCDYPSFPLLLKYLDCNRVLSVQVHPDDHYGQAMPTPTLGKTEAWYIVAAEADSLIYAGLKEGISRRELSEAVEAGQTEQVLHSFRPAAGDCLYIPAGTVHALGAGLLVAEIQQTCNTTFRLFDWNRVDHAGKARALHIQQALDVTDYEQGPVHPRRVDLVSAGWQNLVECDKFILRSLELGEDGFDGGRFHLITVPRGRAELTCDGATLVLNTGESVLVPACAKRVDVLGGSETTVLDMFVP